MSIVLKHDPPPSTHGRLSPRVPGVFEGAGAAQTQLARYSTSNKAATTADAPAAGGWQQAACSASTSGANELPKQITDAVAALWPCHGSPKDQLLRCAAEYLLTSHWAPRDGRVPPLRYSADLAKVSVPIYKHPLRSRVPLKTGELFKESPFFSLSKVGGSDVLTLEVAAVLRAASEPIAQGQGGAEEAGRPGLIPVVTSSASGKAASASAVAAAVPSTAALGAVAPVAASDRILQLKRAIAASWPSHGSPKDQLLRCAADYLLTSQWAPREGRVTPLRYSADLAKVSVPIYKHPLRSRVPLKTGELFKESPFFSLSKAGGSDVLTLDVAAVLLAAPGAAAQGQGGADEARQQGIMPGVMSSASGKAASAAAVAAAGPSTAAMGAVTPVAASDCVLQLKRAIAALWPSHGSPKDQLLRCAADYLLTSQWAPREGRVPPLRYSADLAKVSVPIYKHPLRSEVPLKTGELFKKSPFFSLFKAGGSDVLTLDADAVLRSAPGAVTHEQGSAEDAAWPTVIPGAASSTSSKAAPAAPAAPAPEPKAVATGAAAVAAGDHAAQVRHAIAALWPAHGSPKDHLLRCVADFLLTSKWVPRDGTPLMRYSADLAKACTSVSKHPLRTAVPGKTGALFQNLPFFSLSKSCGSVVLTLDVAAVVQAATGAAVQEAGGTGMAALAATRPGAMPGAQAETCAGMPSATSASSERYLYVPRSMLRGPASQAAAASGSGQAMPPSVATAGACCPAPAGIPPNASVSNAGVRSSTTVAAATATTPTVPAAPGPATAATGAATAMAANDHTAQLRNAVAILWPAHGSPREQLLRCAVDYLLNLQPMQQSADSPHRCSADLAKACVPVGQHPLRTAVPGKTWELFRASPFFSLSKEGAGMVLTLEDEAVLQKATKMALEALWPVQGPDASPHTQLLRCTAEHLLESRWMPPDRSLPPLQHSDNFADVGNVLRGHPLRATVRSTLGEMCQGSPIFSRSVVCNSDVLTLNVAAVLQAAAGAGVISPAATSAVRTGARAGDDPPVHVMPPQPSLRARMPGQATCSASAVPLPPTSPSPSSLQTSTSADTATTIGGEPGQPAPQQHSGVKRKLNDGIGVLPMLCIRNERGHLDRVEGKGLGRVEGNSLDRVEGGKTSGGTVHATAVIDKVDDCLLIANFASGITLHRVSDASGSSKAISQHHVPAQRSPSSEASAPISHSQGQARLPGQTQQPRGISCSALSTANALAAAIAAAPAAQPGRQTMTVKHAVGVLWPSNGSPKDHLLRCAAKHLLTSQWVPPDGLSAPLQYSANLGQVGEWLQQHPLRAAVDCTTGVLFKGSEYFRLSKVSKSDVLTLDVAAVMQAAAGLKAGLGAGVKVSGGSRAAAAVGAAPALAIGTAAAAAAGTVARAAAVVAETTAATGAAAGLGALDAPTSMINPGAASTAKVSDSQLRHAMTVVWPPSSGAKEQLLRCAADFLLHQWWQPRDGSERLHYTTSVDKVAIVLFKHPHKAALPAKLSTLFVDSPFFTLSTQIWMQVVTLNVAALTQAAAGREFPGFSATPPPAPATAATLVSAHRSQLAPSAAAAPGPAAAAEAMQPPSASARLCHWPAQPCATSPGSSCTSSATAQGSQSAQAPWRVDYPDSSTHTAGAAEAAASFAASAAAGGYAELRRAVGCVWPAGRNPRDDLLRHAAEHLIGALWKAVNGTSLLLHTADLAEVKLHLDKHPLRAPSLRQAGAWLKGSHFFIISPVFNTKVVTLDAAALLQAAAAQQDGARAASAAPAAHVTSAVQLQAPAPAVQPLAAGSGTAHHLSATLPASSTAPVSGGVSYSDVQVRHAVDALWPDRAGANPGDQLLRCAARYLLNATWAPQYGAALHMHGSSMSFPLRYTGTLGLVCHAMYQHPQRPDASSSPLALLKSSPFFSIFNVCKAKVVSLLVDEAVRHAVRQGIDAVWSPHCIGRWQALRRTAQYLLAAGSHDGKQHSALLSELNAALGASVLDLRGASFSLAQLLSSSRCFTVTDSHNRSNVSLNITELLNVAVAHGLGDMLPVTAARAQVAPGAQSAMAAVPAPPGRTLLVRLPMTASKPTLKIVPASDTLPASGATATVAAATAATATTALDLVRQGVEVAWPPQAIQGQAKVQRFVAELLLKLPPVQGAQGPQYNAKLSRISDSLIRQPFYSACRSTTLSAMLRASPYFVVAGRLGDTNATLRIGELVQLAVAQGGSPGMAAQPGLTERPQAVDTTPAPASALEPTPAPSPVPVPGPSPLLASAPGVEVAAAAGRPPDLSLLWRAVDAVWPWHSVTGQAQVLRFVAEYLLKRTVTPGKSVQHKAKLCQISQALLEQPFYSACRGTPLSQMLRVSPYFTVGGHLGATNATLNTALLVAAAEAQGGHARAEVRRGMAEQPPEELAAAQARAQDALSPTSASAPASAPIPASAPVSAPSPSPEHQLAASTSPASAPNPSSQAVYAALDAIWPPASVTGPLQVQRFVAECLLKATPGKGVQYKAKLCHLGDALFKQPFYSACRGTPLSQMLRSSPYFAIEGHLAATNATLNVALLVANVAVQGGAEMPPEALLGAQPRSQPGAQSEAKLAAQPGAQPEARPGAQPEAPSGAQPGAQAAQLSAAGQTSADLVAPLLPTGLSVETTSASAPAPISPQATSAAPAHTPVLAPSPMAVPTPVPMRMLTPKSAPASPAAAVAVSPTTMLAATTASPMAAAGSSAGNGVMAASTSDVVITLPGTVLQVAVLHVRIRALQSVAASDVQWLLQAQQPGSSAGGGLAPICIGFDTEFSIDRLALIQLGNADRVLLVQVPANGRVSEDESKQQLTGGGPSSCQPSQTSQLSQPPASHALVNLLLTPSVLKAAAEAWQDALMVYHNLRIPMAGVVCLTRALEPLFPKFKPGLFTMLQRLFPACGLEKDKDTSTSDWSNAQLTDTQIRYAALDAFASWAVAAARRGMVDGAPKVNLLRISQLELRLVCDIMSVHNHRRYHNHYVVAHGLSGVKHEVYDYNGTLTRAETGRVKGDSEDIEKKALKAAINKVLHGEVSQASCSLLTLLSSTAPTPAAPSTSTSDTLGTSRSGAAAFLWQQCSAAGLNSSQQEAVVATLLPEQRLQLVHGPPGTGKTHVIREAASLWCSYPSLEPPVPQQQGVPLLVCCTCSNVAAMNIAHALLKSPATRDSFRLVVSHEFCMGCNEHAEHLEKHLITPDTLSKPGAGRGLEETMKVLVCTLSMLCSDRLHLTLLHNRCVVRMLVDEASQVYVGDYLPHMQRFAPTLRSITFFGDNKQLPVFGSELRRVCSVFDSHFIWDKPGASAGGSGYCYLPSVLLDITYRLPPQLCAFVSQHMYGGQLKPATATAGVAIHNGSELVWQHVDGTETFRDKSVMNVQEAQAVRNWATVLQGAGHKDWKVLSLYDAQRQAVEDQLRSQPGLPWEERVYNVDTFQGREEDGIIVTLACTSGLGFLSNDRRVNVVMTRCKQWLVVVGDVTLALRHPDTLIGKLALYCQERGLVLPAS